MILAAFFSALSGAILLVGLGDLRSHAFLAVGILLAWGGVVWMLLQRAELKTDKKLLLAALCIRLILLYSPPGLSDDVFRYVWEGEVWRAGKNPFLLAPASEELRFLRDAVWEQVNHKQISTIYPPLSQGLSWFLAPGGVLAWKAAMGLFDVGTAWLLGKRSSRAGWLWALLPLGAVESAGSGHLEGAGVFFLVAAMGGGRLSWVWAWAGAMVKLLPGILLVRLLKPWPLVGLGIISAGLFMGIGGEGLLRGFGAYEAHWSFNSSLYLLNPGMEDALWRRFLQGVGAIVVFGILVKSKESARIALWSCGAFVCLSPTVHPWYVLWPLAASLFLGRNLAWEWLGMVVPLCYSVLGSYNPATSSWSEPVWVAPLEYGPFYLLLLYQGVKSWLLPSKAPCW